MSAESQNMSLKWLKQLLEDIKRVRIALYGDFCLDAYWIMDKAGSEVSVETGLKAEAVERHYYSPGGASNLAANLVALEPSVILAMGVTGDDIFGRELRSQLENLGIDISALLIQESNFDTYTFVKKYRKGKEEPRIDFGANNSRTEETDERILWHIKNACIEYDALILNQQVPGSITHSSFIERLNQIINEFPDKIVLVDSRHYIDRFSNVFRKMNEKEVAALNGIDLDTGENVKLDLLKKFGSEIYRTERKPVFITCGDRGILAVDESGMDYFSGLEFDKPLDTVGAGDTTISALALCLAAGYTPKEAAYFANLAAGVTVQKMFTTGTASGSEIIRLFQDQNFRIK